MKRASDNLVRAAQKAAFDKTEDDSVVVKTKFVGGIAQVRAQEKKSNYDVRARSRIYLFIYFFVVCPFHSGFAFLADMPKCQMFFFFKSAMMMSCCG